MTNQHWAMRLFFQGKGGRSDERATRTGDQLFSRFSDFVTKHSLPGSDGTGYVCRDEELKPFLEELDDLIQGVCAFNLYLNEIRDGRRLVFTITLAE